MGQRAAKVIVSLTALCLSLIVLEVSLRSCRAIQSFAGGIYDHGPPLHVPVDLPYLYGLNPKHPEISPQALRDDEISTSKPDGALRVLVLGDSVAYGAEHHAIRRFPIGLRNYFRISWGR